jgi:hypothetical protein
MVGPFIHRTISKTTDYEREAARRYEVAIERLLAADKEIPPCSERNGAIANKLNEAGVQTSQGRPWTADNVKKTLQRLQAKR